MKNNTLPILIVILSLVFVSLGCKTLSNLGSKPEQASPQEQIPTGTPEPHTEPTQEVVPSQPIEATSQPEPTLPDSAGSQTQSADFPMPPGAQNVINKAGLINFQAKMNLNDVMSFYRETFSKEGLIENKLLTVVSATTFNLVFTGAANGQALVIQGTDLGNGMINVSLFYEKL